MSDELFHYGTPRHSGRYPWGSGEEPYQSDGSFLSYISELQKKGMTESQIAKAMEMNTSQLRARKTWAIAEQRAADRTFALRLKDKGYSNVAIGKRMGINESSVRGLLDPALAARSNELFDIADKLKEAVGKGNYIDVGRGVENHLGISRTKLKTAVAMLEDQGYEVHYLSTRQVGTGHDTSIMVIGPKGSTGKDAWENKDNVRMFNRYDMLDAKHRVPPKSVEGKRVYIRYLEDGGGDKDGIIEVRRGIDDISLGESRYAQVRVGVDDKHYMKGVALYSDEIPPGYDMVYNTTKKKGTPPGSVFKQMEDDILNPFGAVTAPKFYVDKDGKEKQSKLNVIYEEGDWSKWSNNLSSQMLSKQRPSLADRQLKLQLANKKAEYEEIMSLTNSAVRRRLLEGFADDADAAATHLKAAALPRQSNHVLLPFDDIKENEIYAPNYKNGEKVVLIRHPHGGIFEIPQLTVNNRGSAKANRAVKNAKDAVGINPKVAQRLSGADFDGDTVLVIPNNKGAVKVSGALEGLKNFEPSVAYPAYEGMPKVSPKTGFRMPIQMGGISNLITDMTIKGASQDEIARAVRHSMVVIDAEKHNLNYKASAIDNGIASLKKKYQGRATAGASTLISRASSEKMVPQREKYAKIDPKTGKKIWTETGASYINKDGKRVYNMSKSDRMSEVDNAYELSSGTLMESVYADYANSMKALANQSRKELIRTPNTVSSSKARVNYKKEVDSLTAKLNVALKNAPLERHAHLKANMIIDAKKKANPDMDKKELKRISAQALEDARVATGAKKQMIKITEKEWEAIQKGAISDNRLSRILDNANLDDVKKLATPREDTKLSGARLGKAKAMLNSGYTQAEVAEALGISTTTLSKVLS